MEKKNKNSKGKVLALDVGIKKIGYAISDINRMLATPKGFIKKENRKNKEVFEDILKIIKSNNIKELIVGLPSHKDGNLTKVAFIILKFIKKLYLYLKYKNINVPIYFVDENFTTQKALEIKKQNKSKNIEDAIAAAIFLQDYLDNFSKPTLAEELFDKYLPKDYGEKEVEKLLN